MPLVSRFFRARVLLCAGVVIASVPRAFAQQSVAQATVSGTVTDASAGVVAGATVVAHSLDRGLDFTTTTDGHGRYRFSHLPVDRYEVRAERPPFRPAARRISLTIGQALDLPFRLAMEAQAEFVEVTAEGPVVETVRTQVAETVTPQDMASLPMNGRNYLDLAALTPGVSRQNPAANQRFPETSAVPGTGISVTGQRFINNTFVVDGLSANDDAADLPGTFFSQEVISQFQVVSSGGMAEFGRASAGVVNVLTRSGTGAWHGSAYGFFRDDALDAQNALAPTKDPLRQWQYGASLGGPLAAGRTFGFANFEQTRNDYSGVITVPEAAVAAINARLRAVGYRGPQIATGLFPTGFDTTNAFVRVDHRPSQKYLLTARYSYYDVRSPNARSVGGLSTESRGTSLGNTDHTLAASLVAALSDRAVNETRVQATRSRLGAPPNDFAGPAVNIAGVASFGTSTTSPTERDIDLYQLVNVLSLERGSHSPKAGIDFTWNRLDIGFPGAVQGVYAFSNLATFLTGTYANFQQAFGAEHQFQSNPNLGLFLQDEWRVGRTLTLNAGLRYDLQLLPDPVATDADNISPRMGVAWAPGDGHTVVRASLGLFFDRIPLRATSNALQRDGSKYQVAVLSFGQAGAPVFPSVLTVKPTGFVPSITTIDPGIENGQARQASLQVERQIARETSVALAYLHLRGSGTILSRNVNVPTLTAAEAAALGIPNLGRPDPRYGNVSQYQSLGSSAYDGLTVSARRRFAGAFGGRVSYTFGKALDDGGNAFFFTPQDNAHPEEEKGRSDNDQHHRLVLAGTAEAAGFALSLVYTYGSALPFNVLAGADRNADTSNNDRPPDVGRNTGQGFDFSSLDLRLSRLVTLTGTARLNLMVEAYNLFNRANYQLPNATFGTAAVPRPGFGQPTAAADARQLQFGLRLEF